MPLKCTKFVFISLTDSFDCSDNFFIDSATTENPFPCSPALAASIDALSASKFVCSAIPATIDTIFVMSFALFSKSSLFTLTSLKLSNVTPMFPLDFSTPELLLLIFFNTSSKFF